MDVFPELSGGRPLSGLLPALSQLPLKKQLMMIGNGVHVPMLAAWILYVIGNACPRGHFFALPKQPSVLHAGDIDDEQD